MQTNYKTARRFADIAKDIRVKYVSDERGIGDGIWIYLEEGYIATTLEGTVIHEQTVRECLQELNYQVIDNTSPYYKHYAKLYD
jgi:hypothetical protein